LTDIARNNVYKLDYQVLNQIEIEIVGVFIEKNESSKIYAVGQVTI